MTDVLDDAARAVLHERALALSRELVTASRERGTEMLAFTRRGTSYALDASLVREIARLEALTPVPGVPAPFAGVVAIRGRIVPVADLSMLAGSAGEEDEPAYVVILEANGPELGVLADDVDRVDRIEAVDVHAPPASLATLGCATGITDTGTVVLSGTALLADRRLFVDRAGHDGILGGVSGKS